MTTLSRAFSPSAGCGLSRSTVAMHEQGAGGNSLSFPLLLPFVVASLSRSFPLCAALHCFFILFLGCVSAMVYWFIMAWAGRYIAALISWGMSVYIGKYIYKHIHRFYIYSLSPYYPPIIPPLSPSPLCPGFRVQEIKETASAGGVVSGAVLSLPGGGGAGAGVTLGALSI